MPDVRVLLIAGAIVFAVAPDAHGQYVPDQNIPDVKGVCVSNCGSGNSGSGISIQDIIQSFTDARHTEAVGYNNQGNARVRAGDDAGAVPLYRRAHDMFRDDPVIRMNLIRVLLVMAGRSDLQQAGRLLNEIEGLNDGSLQSDSRYNAMTTDLAQLRARVKSAPQIAAAGSRISSISGDLARQMSKSGSTGGAGFGDPGVSTVTSTAAAARDRAQNPNTDTSVVDLRGASSTPALLRSPSLPPHTFSAGLPRLTEVENSPGRDDWQRGMQAAAGHNWEQATSAFETARALDPNNAALRRAVDLAQWTRDFYRRADARAVAALRVPKDEDLALLFPGTDPALRVPSDDDLKFLFQRDEPDLSPTPEERTRRAAFSQIGSTPPEDLRLGFSDPVKDRADMVASISYDQRQRLTDKGAALPAARDWTDQLNPEVRGMLAELREALPPLTYGPPRPNEDIMRSIDTGMANAAGDQAVVLLLYGDLEGAQRALGEVEKMNASFHKAYSLIDEWRQPSSAITGLAPGGQSRQ